MGVDVGIGGAAVVDDEVDVDVEVDVDEVDVDVDVALDVDVGFDIGSDVARVIVEGGAGDDCDGGPGDGVLGDRGVRGVGTTNNVCCVRGVVSDSMDVVDGVRE